MTSQSRRLFAGTIAVVACAVAGTADAQETTEKPTEKPTEKRTPPLFERESPLAVTFTTNIRQLRRDKDAKAPWRTASLTYARGDSAPMRVPVRAKTHGIWRLAHCDFPPVRLNFSSKAVKHTLFEGVDQPKLTNYCRDTDAYEQLLLQELQLYRIYQLLTPRSHRARLLRVAYADSATGTADITRYAFVIEDPNQMAARLNGTILKIKGARPGDFEAPDIALAYLFQYFIANTDFSFNQLHNAEIIGLVDGRNVPVAYDFDFAGAVNAPYATPDPSVRIRRVRDRRFRGYCELRSDYTKLFPLFREKKDAIYALYGKGDEVGRLLDDKVVKETLSYYDEFYAALDRSAGDSPILDDCIEIR
jgi:hypothetical protein